jgi:hypothetical protein
MHLDYYFYERIFSYLKSDAAALLVVLLLGISIYWNSFIMLYFYYEYLCNPFLFYRMHIWILQYASFIWKGIKYGLHLSLVYTTYKWRSKKSCIVEGGYFLATINFCDFESQMDAILPFVLDNCC